MFLKIIIIKAGRTINILIKIFKGGLTKKLNYIFKLFKFKLRHSKGFIIIVINSEITYILVRNNINYNIIVPRHQRLNKAIIFNIKKNYYILIKEKYLANKLILIKKKFTIIIILLTMSML